MKTHRALFVALMALFVSNVVIAAPNLKMPFPAGEFWTMTRGYNQDTHVNYSNPTSQDKYALDFVLPGCNAYGKPAIAVANGVVEFAGLNGGYGNTVVVNHGDGYKSRYAHLSEISVHQNDVISQGQEVGRMGNTGNVFGSACKSYPGTHLHFAMYYDGQAFKAEPMDGYNNIGNINGALFLSGNYRPGEVNIDEYCKKISPDYRVERFRSSSGNLVVNACPSDGRVYYYKDVTFGSCSLGYINLFADTDGVGGYQICTGSKSGTPSENYGSDPTGTIGDTGGGSTTPPVSGSDNSGDLPNLTMRDVYLLDGNKNKVSSIHVNKKGYCHMNVKNTGTKKANGPFWNQCWRSDGKKFDGKDDAENLGKDDMDDLDDGRSRSSDEDFDGIEWPGTYNFVGCTDVEKTVTESNEKDNCNVGDHAVLQEFVFEVVSSPNLQTTAINLTNGKTVLALNEPFVISSITFNAGENFGPRYVYIGYFIDGTLVGQNQIRRDNMKGGVSKAEEISVSGGIATAGTHEIKACADFSNDIEETNETDNCLSMTVKVNDPNMFYPCNTVAPQNFFESAYNGYGAPFDLFGGNATLVDAKCSLRDTHTIQATVGKVGDTTRIVYTKGYYFDPGINNWAPYTGTCTGTLNGGWCAGPLTVTITDPDISTASAGAPVYFVGMVCSVQGGGWKCGCRDTTCNNFYWMLQGAGL